MTRKEMEEKFEEAKKMELQMIANLNYWTGVKNTYAEMLKDDQEEKTTKRTK